MKLETRWYLLCGLMFAAMPALVSGEGGTGSEAEGWRSELYPMDWTPPGEELNFYEDKIIQDFSRSGYRGGLRMIPSIEGPVFQVTDAPFRADVGGEEDSTTAIQAAIDAAASAGGGVIYLPAGTYRVAPQEGQRAALTIRDSGVVLRGAGRDQTFIVNTSYQMRSREVIRVEGPEQESFFVDREPTVPIRRDLMGPTRSIPVVDTAAFSVGDRVVLRTDTTEEWVAEHNEPDWSGHTQLMSGLAYPRRVVAIDEEARRLEVDVPIRYAMKTRDNARVHLAVDAVMEVGLEHFSIGNVQHPGEGWENPDYTDPDKAAYDVHHAFLIAFDGAENCWVDRVSSFRPESNSLAVHTLSNGIFLHHSRFITLSNVEMQRVQYGGWGGNGYTYRIQDSADNLIIESLAAYNRHGFVFSHMATTGNVIHRSLDRQSGIAASGTADSSGSDHHMRFSHSNLVDQSTVENSFFDARYRPYGSIPRHNISAAHSVFWNIRGKGSKYTDIIRTQQARYGYAIGTSGEVYNVYTLGNLPQTDPIDHVEGVGKGETLEPQSLYLDQLQRSIDPEKW
ncbi:MAG: hypothetical protein JJU20_00075 [Opitutales bacterium]|nr:hypothetical protein [Opitutales bacterium]